MKLILAIVNNDDSQAVLNTLTESRFQVTKLATTGGFLSKGNTTLITGVDDDKVDEAIKLIGNEAKKRTEYTSAGTVYESGGMMSMPVEVTVGGATVFVLDVAQFIKL